MADIINYQTTGTCAKQINLEIEDDIIKNVDFLGGCPGNLIGIKALITGKNINEVKDKLKGIRCGLKPTSCPDQLAVCLEEYIAEKQAQHA